MVFVLSMSEGAATIPPMSSVRPPTQVPDPDPRERALARTIGQSDLLARVLLARGLDDPDRARRHMRPDLSTLADPFAFRQMERAVERIRRAIRDGERILVHGDYDVDGVTGTVLLLKFFSLMGVAARPFIPDRRQGYSFSAASVEAAREGGFSLCISVDNGTNACEPIRQLQEAGCDVIVTDHHGTSDNVAEAFAILNPRLPEAGYPDRDLAGCGVAFRLATAIAQSFSQGKRIGDEFRAFLLDAMAYVALGTVADVAPLRGENRTMVLHGLKALAISPNPGIRALLDCAGIGARAPDAEDIAFRIAPLINAAGRMGHAMEAVDLLSAPGYQEAQQAAKILERHNEQRRRVERELLERVKRAAAAFPEDRILVLGDDDWHPGVLGIVAARMAESTGRPSILISFDGPIGRGSGRSPGGIHLREAMRACADLLRSYGGHAAAAGLEIERARLDEFRLAINAVADRVMGPTDPIQVDGCANFDELDPRDVRVLDQLGPFGAGNRRPTFLTRDARLVGLPSVDPRSGDLRLRAVQTGQILPARLRAGARHFETIRGWREPVDLVHSPRLSARSEEGPVELVVWQIQRPTAGGEGPEVLP
jgi:single-stranded-DNA-specific exonuclease